MTKFTPCITLKRAYYDIYWIEPISSIVHSSNSDNRIISWFVYQRSELVKTSFSINILTKFTFASLWKEYDITCPEWFLLPSLPVDPTALIEPSEDTLEIKPDSSPLASPSISWPNYTHVSLWNRYSLTHPNFFPLISSAWAAEMATILPLADGFTSHPNLSPLPLPLLSWTSCTHLSLWKEYTLTCPQSVPLSPLPVAPTATFEPFALNLKDELLHQYLDHIFKNKVVLFE